MPVTLELGGKSALIVDKSVDIDKAVEDGEGAACGAGWRAARGCAGALAGRSHQHPRPSFSPEIQPTLRSSSTTANAARRARAPTVRLEQPWGAAAGCAAGPRACSATSLRRSPTHTPHIRPIHSPRRHLRRVLRQVGGARGGARGGRPLHRRRGAGAAGGRGPDEQGAAGGGVGAWCWGRAEGQLRGREFVCHARAAPPSPHPARPLPAPSRPAAANPTDPVVH